MFFLRILFTFFSSLIFTFILILFFKPIFYTGSIIIDFGFTAFDMCIKYPKLWFFLKLFYPFVSFFSSFIIFNSFYTIFLKPNTHQNKKIIPPKGLYLYLGTSNRWKCIFARKRPLSKYFNYWHNWIWKNKFCYVPFYKATHKIQLW